MSIEHLQLLTLILAVSSGFYVQMIAGFGSALMALPILLISMEIQEATTILSIFFFVFSLIQIFYNYSSADRSTVAHLIIGTVMGMIIGVIVLKFGKPDVLKKILGAFIILYVISRLATQRVHNWINKVGLLFGFGSGFFSGLFSSGGPLCVIYVYNKMFDAKVFRSTVILVLGLTDLVKLPVLIATDILDWSMALKAFYALPFFLLALFLGKLTYKRINEILFRKLLLILLSISGIFLLVR